MSNVSVGAAPAAAARGLSFADVIRLGEAKRAKQTSAAERKRVASRRLALPAIVPVAWKPAAVVVGEKGGSELECCGGDL